MTAALVALAAAVFLLPTSAQAATQAAQARRVGDCAAGELCLWKQTGFKGGKQVYDLAHVDMESCTALPPGTEARSLVNRTGRPVTAYRSGVCQETAEFDTYPGGGTWVPQIPYPVRAFKVWES
ncbi:hypothetical protein GCM10010260_73570 [Streptomyces filipinensis]|uniref:Peptidase inhibitor family I36 n=1 Tax=Streptomyces filipinensis TaxID=66887 RepID=A0A918MFP9_9ACTN|nr:peptidase inhibitor family I36 protein [Streptomyces filipinensis]GGV22528.1 hypothetical protein GCM10010260_73570 [Streptomyces filipinensis]